MADVSVYLDKDIAGLAARLGTEVPAKLKKSLHRASEILVGVVRKVVIEKFPKGKGGLARSYRPKVDEDKFSAGAISNLIYADIQNRGGIVAPVQADWLAIPLLNLGTPIGVSPRDIPGLVAIKGKTNPANLILGEVTGKGKTSKFNPKFVLTKRVELTGKHYLEMAAEEAKEDVAAELMAGLLEAFDAAA